MKEIRRQQLQEKQSEGLPWLIVFGCVILAIDAFVILMSHFVYKDERPNYVTLLQCSLALFDVASDVAVLVSLGDATQTDEAFSILFVIGVSTLVLALIINVVSATVIIRSERIRKETLDAWCKQHPYLVGLSLLLSPAKANFILLFDARLWLSVSGTCFDAPLPVMTRTKFRVVGVVGLLLEDLVQIVLLACLFPLLGGWTAMNGISFTCSWFALLGGAAINLVALKSSYKTNKLKSSGSPEASNPSADRGIKAN